MVARKRIYRSDALRSVHSAAEDLRAIGAIDEATMRRLDTVCLRDLSDWDEFFDGPGADLGERRQPNAETREPIDQN